MMLLGGAGLKANPAFAANLLNTSTVSGVRSASLTFNTDGTTSPSGGTSSANNWFTPTTTGIGSNFWVKATVSSGSNYVLGGAAAGVWVQISTSRAASINNSTSTTEAVGNMLVQFSTDGGASVCNSFTVAFDVGYAP
jgi:hypothetical protein